MLTVAELSVESSLSQTLVWYEARELFLEQIQRENLPFLMGVKCSGALANYITLRTKPMTSNSTSDNCILIIDDYNIVFTLFKLRLNCKCIRSSVCIDQPRSLAVPRVIEEKLKV